MAFRSRSLRLLTRSIRTQAQYDYAPKPDYNEYIHAGSEGLATPRQVCLPQNLILPMCNLIFYCFTAGAVSR